MNETVSIIITEYNSEKYIEKCLNSVLKQTYKNIEIIVINDGSMDNSLKIIEKFKNNNSNIKLFNQENKGPAVAKNIGLRYSTGNYIMFLDSDDWIEEDFVEKLMDIIEEKKANIVFFNSIEETEKGQVLGKILLDKYKDYNNNEILKMHITGTIPPGSHKIISRKAIKQANAEFTEDLKNGEELEYSIKCLNKVDRIDYMKNSFYHCVQRTNSQSRKERKSFIKNVEKLRDVLNNERILDKYKNEFLLAVARFMILDAYNECLTNHFLIAKNNINKIIHAYVEKYDVININDFKYTTMKIKLLYKILMKREILLFFIIMRIYLIYKRIRNKV